MNKKGGEEVMFIVFFFIMIIIGGGIVAGVYVFYGDGYDARQSEADILFGKVRDCIADNQDVVFEAEFSLDKCGLDEEVLSEEHLIYIKKGDKEFFVGVFDYSNRCLFQEAGTKSKTFPKCLIREIGDYEVIVASNQRGRKL